MSDHILASSFNSVKFGQLLSPSAGYAMGIKNCSPPVLPGIARTLVTCLLEDEQMYDKEGYFEDPGFRRPRCNTALRYLWWTWHHQTIPQYATIAIIKQTLKTMKLITKQKM